MSISCTARQHAHINTSRNCHHGPLHVNAGKMPCRLYKDNDGGVVVVDSEALVPMFGLCGGLLRMKATTRSRTCSRFCVLTKQKQGTDSVSKVNPLSCSYRSCCYCCCGGGSPRLHGRQSYQNPIVLVSNLYKWPMSVADNIP